MKRLVAVGILQGPKPHLEIAADYLKAFAEGLRVILEGIKRAQESGQDSHARPRMYRGKSNLDNQSIN